MPAGLPFAATALQLGERRARGGRRVRREMQKVGRDDQRRAGDPSSRGTPDPARVHPGTANGTSLVPTASATWLDGRSLRGTPPSSPTSPSSPSASAAPGGGRGVLPGPTRGRPGTDGRGRRRLPADRRRPAAGLGGAVPARRASPPIILPTGHDVAGGGEIVLPQRGRRRWRGFWSSSRGGSRTRGRGRRRPGRRAIPGVVRGARPRAARRRCTCRLHPDAPGIGPDGEAAPRRDPHARRLARRQPSPPGEPRGRGAGAETRRHQGSDAGPVSG